MQSKAWQDIRAKGRTKEQLAALDASVDRKVVRLKAKRSQMSVATEACVSLPTLRLYEANRDAVSEDKRAALDAVYAKMKEVQS